MKGDWYVAHTKIGKDDLAVFHLRRQGFDAFSPRVQKMRRHARQEETVLRPLFPGYVFISFDRESHQWRSINGTVGVKYLLCSHETPVSVPDEFMDRMFACTDKNGLLTRQMVELFAGQPVKVTEGHFRGQEGRFMVYKPKERVQLLLSILGQQVSVTIPSFAVVPT